MVWPVMLPIPSVKWDKCCKDIHEWCREQKDNTSMSEGDYLRQEGWKHTTMDSPRPFDTWGWWRWGN